MQPAPNRKTLRDESRLEGGADDIGNDDISDCHSKGLPLTETATD
jgi:hypothetical protein